MKRMKKLRALLRSEAGETIVEFAIVSVVFFTLLCAIIEYGLILMTKIAIESATQQVARSSGIDTSNTTCDRACQITALVQQNMHGIINASTIYVTSEVISSPTEAAPAEPDVCLDDPSNPYPATCTKYNDNNGIPLYQQNVISAGGSSDLVQISVFYNWQIIFPLMRAFYPSGVVPITSTTVIKNEPF